MKIKLTALIVGIGTRIATLSVIAHTQMTSTPTIDKIQKIAKDSTVYIRSQEQFGTGVIIHRKGSTYTVLTADHVVMEAYLSNEIYSVTTSDGVASVLNPETVKPFAGLDLALLEFSSNRKHHVVSIGDSTKIIRDEPCYIYGFPKAGELFTEGIVLSNLKKRLLYGRSLACSNRTSDGMSGGPILDKEGQLIGIFSLGTSSQESHAYPISAGIPTNLFLEDVRIVKKDIDFQKHKATKPVQPKTWVDFNLQAWHFQDKRDFKNAISNFSKALALNPKNGAIHLERGNSYLSSGSVSEAISDFTAAIKINGKDSNAYNSRGVAYNSLEKFAEALSDFNKAILANPKNANAYANRGEVHRLQGNDAEAIRDLNKAIALDPGNAKAFYNRGSIYASNGNSSQAKEDLNTAIEVFEKKYFTEYEDAVNLLKQL